MLIVSTSAADAERALLAGDLVCPDCDGQLRRNRIVGYSMDGRMPAELAVAALRNAVALRRQ